MALLEATGLTVTFGGLRAVDDVSIRVEPGQLVGLIGPNGAGKTTFIDGLTGYVPIEGQIVFDGRNLTSAEPHERARAGLVRTWQSLELFDDLTVEENLRVAAETSSVKGVVLDLLWPNRTRRVASVEDALRRVDIGDLVDRVPVELSQGQRKLIGVARALAADPKLVLMDEPAAGLDTHESQELGRRLRRIVDDGTAVLLIDHDMGLVLTVCDYIYVIEFGRLIAAGTPTEIRTDERVITAYLGEQARREVDEAKATLAALPLDVEGVIRAEDAVLSHFSLRYCGLEERFAAAREAGFDSVGLFINAFLDAEAAGVSPDAQRGLADRHGVTVTDIEALRPWWGDEADRRRAVEAEATAFRMADVFGSRYVQVIGPYHGDLEVAAERFGALCDRAGAHGLTVGLEFLPFNNIPDAGVARQIVATAGRANGGVCLDSWHHFRGQDDDLVRALSAEWVTSVQLDDGAALPVDPDYYTDCLENRQVPGEGEFDLVGFVRLLDEMDVSAPVSLEVISTQLQALSAVEAATRIRQGFLRVLEAARS